MKSMALLFTTVLFLTAGPNLYSDEWKVDKSHSRVNFTVTHMVVGEVTGMFREFDVTLISSGDDIAGGKLEATIGTASIFTDNEKRDSDLRSAKFFDTETYPEMRFMSSSITKTGENRYRIEGDLTIRDVTKPVVLDTELRGMITDQRGKTRAGIKSTSSINRFDYGLKWNAAIETGGLVVGEDVDITLLMEMIRQ